MAQFCYIGSNGSLYFLKSILFESCVCCAIYFTLLTMHVYRFRNSLQDQYGWMMSYLHIPHHFAMFDALQVFFWHLKKRMAILNKNMCFKWESHLSNGLLVVNLGGLWYMWIPWMSGIILTCGYGQDTSSTTQIASLTTSRLKILRRFEMSQIGSPAKNRVEWQNNKNQLGLTKRKKLFLVLDKTFSV